LIKPSPVTLPMAGRLTGASIVNDRPRSARNYVTNPTFSNFTECCFGRLVVGDGCEALDQPLDSTSSWRTLVGIGGSANWSRLQLHSLPHGRGRELAAQAKGQRLVPLSELEEPLGDDELPVAGSMIACSRSGLTSITMCDPSGACAWMT